MTNKETSVNIIKIKRLSILALQGGLPVLRLGYFRRWQDVSALFYDNIEEKVMYIVKTEESFDSAHFLAGYNGKCKNIHGHRWKVVLEVAGKELDDCGMVIDFSDLKRELKSFVDVLDHSLIIEKNSLKPATYSALIEEGFRIVEMNFTPTAENFAKYIYEEFKNKGFDVRGVEVYETPKNCARYEEI